MIQQTNGSAACARSSARAYAVAAAAGIMLWFMASFASGKREAWDDSIYWTLAYPAAVGISALLAYFFPARSWRWPLTLFLGQFIGMTIRNGEIGNLWPLGMIMFAILAAPGAAVAKLASAIRNRSINTQR